MTSPESTSDPSLLIVEAFIDGETIDLEALKTALASPESREHLVELLSLRDAVWTMAPGGYAPRVRQPTPLRRGVRWLAVAASVMLSVAAGYISGQSARPPQSSGVEAIMLVGDGNVAPAPLPTHVISLRPGVNWTEASGGR